MNKSKLKFQDEQIPNENIPRMIFPNEKNPK